MNERHMRTGAEPLPHSLARPRRSLAGYSLIELMLAITIGLIIVAALVSALAGSSGGSKTNQRTSELQTNGRYALDSLKYELRAAGFLGYTWAEPNTPTTTITPLTNECLETGAAAGSFVKNLRQGIWGANDSNPFSTNCIPVGDFATGGGDVLVIRKLAGAPIGTSASLAAGSLYFRSSYSAGELFRGVQTSSCPGKSSSSRFEKLPCLNGVGGTDLQDFAVQIYVYYISPYTHSAAENPLVPALYRVALQAGGAMEKELVASGVEQFQVQYGRATTDLNTRYYNANQIAGTSYDTVSTEWDDVHSLRIWLLVRNSTREPGYSNTRSYAMGEKTYTVNDNYRRQLFSTVIQLRN